MAKHFNAPTSHDFSKRASQQIFNLPIGCMRLFAQANYSEIARECLDGNNDTRGAFLVFMAAARCGELADAAEKIDVSSKIKWRVGEQVYLYLWLHMHEDLMWLVEHSEAWKKIITNKLPWETLLSDKFHRNEWAGSLASLLSVWEPQRLFKYPHALQYMRNPSERHVLEAVLGGEERGYMNPTQIDAFRPGASEWFNMRKELGIEETPQETKRAFRLWWNQGSFENINALNSEVFSATF